MAVFTPEQKQLSKQLIQTVTGFSASEENFKLCSHFVRSNFKYHRYLDVNDLNVSRAIKGLCEKFRVHSQPEKADALETLTDQFLNSKLERNFPRSDAHYGALLFLLCVSDSPLHADYLPTPNTPPVPELSDSFDWASYLMEGIEYPTYSDTDEWSQLSESSSSSWGSTRPPSPVQLSESDDSAVGDLEEPPNDVPSLESQTKSRILQQVTFPYWDATNPDYQTHENKDIISPTSAHSACSLASTWLTYVQSVDPIYHSVDKTTISEVQLVRETLWVLLGAEKSFVYIFDGDCVCLHRGIQLAHLTPLSLKRCLETFALVATKLYKMRSFCKAVVHSAAIVSHDVTREKEERGRVRYVSCRTYEAFADALRSCLKELTEKMRKMERTVIDHSTLITLLSLEYELRPAFRLIHGLYDVFSRGVASLYDSDVPPSASKCSCQLLNELWVAIQQCDILGDTGKELLQLLFPLWAMTVQPYVGLVEQWMVSGSLEDRSCEFCIKRSEEDLVHSLQYWEQCYSLSADVVPICLQPMAEKILISGKSMHLIESFGKLKEVDHIYSSAVSPATPPTKLYDQFLQSLQIELKRQSCDTEEESHDPSVQSASGSPTPPPSPAEKSLEDELFHDNPLMRHFCQSLRPSANSPQLRSPISRWKSLVELVEGGSSLTPLTVLIQSSLSPIVERGYRKASSSLCHLLRSEYTMRKHFHAVWMFYLMEAGPTIHHFCSDVFQRIQNDEPWEDPAYLNAVLHEAMMSTLSHHHNISHFERSFMVQCTPTPSPSLSSSTSLASTHHSLPSLTLHYEVPWPLNIIFSESVMSVYNQVFQLLLHVRWAKWSLEQLRTRASVLATLPVELAHKHHLLYLLRAKLMHFVNNLNNYLVTRILHSAGLEFHQRLEEAEDLDEIIKLHQDYTNIIFDRCLLNKKARVVKEAIMNVLCLAVKFSERWREGVEGFSLAEAEKIEVEFSHCSHFLISCLKNVTKRGHFPHLETLAFSMQTLKSAEKIFSDKRTRLKMSYNS